MCLPALAALPAAASAMSAVSAGVGIASSIVGAAGAMQAANAQAAGMTTRSEWMERQREIEAQKTAYATQQMRREQEQTLGSINLMYSGAGIDPSSGTPRDVAVASQQAANMRQNQRIFAGEENDARLRFEAANARTQAQGYRQAGQRALVGGLLRGFGNFAGSDFATSLASNPFSV